MKKVTNNKLAMYKAVKSVVAEHNSAWNGFVAFNNVYTLYSEKVKLLEEASYNQQLTLVGVSALKDVKRELVAERAYAISSSISAFAVITNKADLIQQMKISRWDLLRGKNLKALQLIDVIIAKGTEHLSELSDFGVDQGLLDELQSLRDDLEIQFGAPRNAIVDRKTLTHSIKTLTIEIDAILKLQLDRLMEMVKEDHFDFFKHYKNARIIVDRKNRPASGNVLPPERDDGSKKADNASEEPDDRV